MQNIKIYPRQPPQGGGVFFGGCILKYFTVYILVFFIFFLEHLQKHTPEFPEKLVE